MSRISKTEGRVRMWAVLSPVTSEILLEKGVLYSKFRFVAQKYGEASWSFLEAYQFLAHHMSEKIPKPAEAESPIWLYGAAQWAVSFEDGIVYEMLVPEDQLFVFDRSLWSKVLNMAYLGEEKEVEQYRDELLKNGVKNSTEIIRTPFYPLLKRKLVKSWDTLFDRIPEKKADLQGAVWLLRKEWIYSINKKHPQKRGCTETRLPQEISY